VAKGINPEDIRVVLVCGGRKYSNYGRVTEVMDHVLSDARDEGKTLRIIQGGATGADELAMCWAVLRQVAYVCEPAEWVKLGLKAGPVRNARMLSLWNPDFVIAFPGGKETKDMVAKARKYGLEVYEKD